MYSDTPALTSVKLPGCNCVSDLGQKGYNDSARKLGRD